MHVRQAIQQQTDSKGFRDVHVLASDHFLMTGLENSPNQ